VRGFHPDNGAVTEKDGQQPLPTIAAFADKLKKTNPNVGVIIAPSGGHFVDDAAPGGNRVAGTLTRYGDRRGSERVTDISSR
jgi:hypothetical protein